MVKVTANVQTVHECSSVNVELQNLSSPKTACLSINTSWSVKRTNWFPLFKVNVTVKVHVSFHCFFSIFRTKNPLQPNLVCLYITKFCERDWFVVFKVKVTVKVTIFNDCTLRQYLLSR